jgi:hypothetical protein
VGSNPTPSATAAVSSFLRVPMRRVDPKKIGARVKDLRTATQRSDSKTVLYAGFFSRAPNYGRLVPSPCSIEVAQQFGSEIRARLELALDLEMIWDPIGELKFFDFSPALINCGL